MGQEYKIEISEKIIKRTEALAAVFLVLSESINFVIYFLSIRATRAAAFAKAWRQQVFFIYQKL